MDVPSIYNYQDPVSFLTSYYRALQSKYSEGSYTLRKWAHSMSLDNPQLLVDIVRRKRKIQFRHLDWIFRGVELDDSERFYFRILVQRESASTAEERMPFDMLLAQLAPFREKKKIYLDDGEIFTDWLNVSIFSFCRIRRIDIDSESIIAAFKSQADRVSVEAAIEKLLLEGLIYRDETGHLRNVDAEISTTADVSIQSVQKYYRQVLGLAERAIDLPPTEREFQCFAVALDSEKLPLLKRLLRSFRKQVLELSNETADCVYQINLQAFPVCQPPLTDVAKTGEHSQSICSERAY